MSDRQKLPPEPLLRAVRRLLRPLVCLLMRAGVTFPVFAELLRGLFIEVAVRDVLIDPASRTDSRISLLTGVHRKEIRRLRETRAESETVPAVITVGSQAIAKWIGMSDYIDSQGRPMALSRAPRPDQAVSFEGLIASVTTDVRPRAVLEDWLAQGLATLDAADQVHLNTAAYIPRAGNEEQLFYFGRNLQDHVAAAAANVSAVGSAPFMDRSLHFDRLSPEAVARLEAFAREAGMRALTETNRLALELSSMETDSHPGPTEPSGQHTRRINFGVYLYTADEPAGPASPA